MGPMTLLAMSAYTEGLLTGIVATAVIGGALLWALVVGLGSD